MAQLILALLPLPLIVFWLWMFSDMTKNGNLPQCFITLTNGRNAELDWTVAFIFLNVITAMFYYVTVYRKRPPH
jgi:hypothetical protein